DTANRTSENHPYVWDGLARQVRLHVPVQGQAAVSPDDKLLAGFVSERNLKLWDLSSGKQRGAMSLGVDEGWITELFWSPDGTRVYAAASQGQLWRWNLSSAEPLARAESIPSSPEGGRPRRSARAQHLHPGVDLYAFGVNADLPERLSKRTLVEDYAELAPPEIVVWDLKTMRRRAVFT